jgi:hypothetical protein
MCKDWAHVDYCNGSYVFEHKPVNSYWCPKTCNACSSSAAAGAASRKAGSANADAAEGAGEAACTLVIVADHWLTHCPRRPRPPSQALIADSSPSTMPSTRASQQLAEWLTCSTS